MSLHNHLRKAIVSCTLWEETQAKRCGVASPMACQAEGPVGTRTEAVYRATTDNTACGFQSYKGTDSDVQGPGCVSTK